MPVFAQIPHVLKPPYFDQEGEEEEEESDAGAADPEVSAAKVPHSMVWF